MSGRYRTVLMTIGVATSLTVAGCDDALNITNLNNPDVDRAFATPVGVETIVSKLFQQMHQGQYLNLPAGGGDNLWTQSMTMSFESSSQLGNFGMGTRGDIPRGLIDNTIGNREEVGNFRDFDHLTRNARMAANAIDAMATFAEEARTLGQRRDLRAKSFAYFTLGYAHGFLSLFYDSVSIVWPGELTGTEVGEFSSAAQGMTAALAMLDSALFFLAQDTASAAFIPAAWMAQSADMSKDQYRRVLRSYKARFRAGVGRTPTERGTADWSAILADATNGITSDLNVNLSVSAGWTNGWVVQAAVSSGWHQITPFIFGMADTSGGYDAWLATPLDSRSPFLIRTPDRRFPAGNDRPTQQQKVPTTTPVIAPDTVLYIRNRPSGQDTPAEAWGTSHYDFVRFWRIRNRDASGGPFPIMTVAEIDMLAAEAHLRAGSFAAAATLIDKYRSQNALPSVASVSNGVDPVPGGNACVPRVPVGPNFTSTVCGNLWEAMKWEKRMETAFTGYGQWYIDSRGWGDLVIGTPLEWPVPYQELFARGLPSYRNERVAARSGYGW